MGPLEGLRALEIGDAGEVAGKLLADAGVDVIRVEPLAGARSRHTGPFVDDVPNPDRSLHFHYRNTSKRGVTLNLDRPEGLDLWRRLVPGVDIVIDSLGPTTLDGLDATDDGGIEFNSGTNDVYRGIEPLTDYNLTGVDYVINKPRPEEW